MFTNFPIQQVNNYPIPTITNFPIRINKYHAPPVQYEDLDKSPDTRNRFVVRYKKKLLEWIPERYPELFSYFIVKKDGSVDLIAKYKDFDKDSYMKDTALFKADKLAFIKEYFINKKFIAKVLENYVNNTGVYWYDLHLYEKQIRRLLIHTLKKSIKNHLINKEI